MRILQIHTYYTRTNTSGENSTVESISSYLFSLSDSKTIYLRVPTRGSSFKSILLQTSELVKSILEFTLSYRRFDAVVIHNQIPFIPNILIRFLSKRVTVVKVWHNLRPFCIGGSAFLRGQVCWKCTDNSKGKLNALINSCYRSSRLQTLLALISQGDSVKILKQNSVYNVTVSNFLRDTLISRGFDKNRVFTISNTANMPILFPAGGDDFVFIGRLTVEKGIINLLQAWNVYKNTYPGHQSLHIIGDGPLLDKLKCDFSDSRTIFHGYLMQDQILELSKVFGFGIIPNLWLEPFGKVALDHMSLGLRILATKSGGIVEILKDDPGVRYISSLEPENLAKEMFDLTQDLVAIDTSLRIRSLHSFDSKVIKSKWAALLEDLTFKLPR